MAHVMLDLESLGLETDAIILSIGAVKFDAGDGPWPTFHFGVDPQSCADLGMTVDVSTIMWWIGRDDDARTDLLALQKHPIQDVLSWFGEWVGEDAKVWGNGSDFDNVLLKKAYDLAGIEVPWKWYNNRCYRTVKNLRPDIEIERNGVHHNALDDALNQARHLVRILKTLNYKA